MSFLPPQFASNSQAALCLMLDVLGCGFDKEGPMRDDYFQLVEGPFAMPLFLEGTRETF